MYSLLILTVILCLLIAVCGFNLTEEVTVNNNNNNNNIVNKSNAVESEQWLPHLPSKMEPNFNLKPIITTVHNHGYSVIESVNAHVTSACHREAIPMQPGDNNHYVDGESRYIWMPNGEGIAQLVDLWEPVDETLLTSFYETKNQYWLYTRQNPDNPQFLVYGDAASIRDSNYANDKPIIVAAHGWNSNGYADTNVLITGVVLAAEDVNVIVLDWQSFAYSNYGTATKGVPLVAQYLGDFLEWLIDTTDGSWNNVHLIGFSIGAHLVGCAGRHIGGKPARITGLDPAKPLWSGNPNALNKNDAQYVEVIHTDGDRLGLFDPTGDADFYPNGGRNPQPGCWLSTCSHPRSPDLFASSVLTNHFEGRLCTNIAEAEKVQCNGDIFKMGNIVVNKRGSGIYGLTTGSSWPF